MKKIIYSILLSSAVLFSSCGDYLNNPPKGVTIPSDVDDYQKLMASQSLMQSNLYDLMEYLSDNVKLLDASATATRYAYVNKSESLQKIYSFAPGDFNPGGTKDYYWNSAYSRIFVWNSVINNVMASNGDERLKKQLKAEALFSRAFDYFMLVNVYGKHYNSATASSDYGVPLVLVDDINNKITKRESVQEVYDLILKDLAEASADLPEIVSYKNHPTKVALDAFYAKIYLAMNDYTKALEYANKTLAVANDLLNLNDYMLQTGTTWDRVVLKSNKTQRYPDIKHPEAIYVRFTSGQLQGSVMLSESLRATFKRDIAHDTTDLRKYYFCSEDMVSLGANPDYFKGECAYVFYANLNSGLTTSETMLIAAECEARVGDFNKGLIWANKLRDSRFNNILTANEYHLTANDKNEALLKILDERRREMMMKSQRIFDIKRLNLESATEINYTHGADGNVWNMTPGSNLLIFPINNVIMDFNPNLPVYDRS